MSTLERLKESSVRRSTVHQVIPVEKVEADGLNGENFFNQSWNYLEGLDGKRARSTLTLTSWHHFSRLRRFQRSVDARLGLGWGRRALLPHPAPPHIRSSPLAVYNSLRFDGPLRQAQPFPRHSVRLSVDHRIKQWVQPRVTDLPTFPLLGLTWT